MSATQRAALSLVIIALCLTLAALRAFGLFGSYLVADGGLFLIVAMGIVAVVLYPHRKDPRGR